MLPVVISMMKAVFCLIGVSGQVRVAIATSRVPSFENSVAEQMANKEDFQ
jgi:hypothetical protein